MEIKTRRYLYVSFIVLFFIVAPIIIIYALGYKYNWTKKSLEKTGVFFIKSFPKNADIYINGKKAGKSTSALITRLLPNYYQVKVSKTGYRPWQKNLQITPQSTTFIEDISLFKESIKPKIIASGNFTYFKQSPDKLYSLIYEKDKNDSKILLLDLANDKMTEYYINRSRQDFEFMAWSYNNQKVILKQKKDYFILKKDEVNSLFPLTDITNISFDNLFWDNLNDNILYGLAGQSLYEINLMNKQLKLQTKLPVLSAVGYKTDVLAIVKDKSQYFLRYLKSDKDPVLALPFSANYILNNPGFNYITIFNPLEKDLYLIEPENLNQPVKTFIKNLTNFEWRDDQFLYWNNNEIWVYYPDVNQNHLIERSSQPIISAFWHPNVVYVFNQTPSEIKVYELDNRDQRNVYSLINFQQSANNLVFINKKGDDLYLITSFNNQPGLYKANIQ